MNIEVFHNAILCPSKSLLLLFSNFPNHLMVIIIIIIYGGSIWSKVELYIRTLEHHCFLYSLKPVVQ